MSDVPRSQVDLSRLDGLLQALSSFHEYLVQVPRENLLIHHYTDLGALSGIVGNHDLWLTHSQYSNDEDESRIGYEIAKEIVERFVKSARRKRAGAKRELRLRVAYAEALATLVEAPPTEGFFICCFCEEDNLLSQWRSYGANGTGVCLAFDPMEFVAITGEDMPLGLMRLWKVFYDKKQQRTIVEQAIEFVWQQRAKGETAAQLAQRAADAIQFFVPTFKNDDFREERERRIIFTPHPACPVKPRYRVGRGMLIPYYSVSDLAQAAGRGSPTSPWHLPIRSVTVGPSAQKSLNVDSTTMMLRQNGYLGVEVRASETPYRG